VSNYLAKFFTFCFHPVLIPTILLLLIYFFAPIPYFYNVFGTARFFSFLLVIFIYTAIFPSIFVFWSFKRKSINDLEISDHTQRPKIFFISSAFYIAVALFLYSKGGALAPTAFIIFTILLNILGLGILSFKYKISAHLSALGGAIGILIMTYLKFGETDLFYPILASFVVSGAVASSRLYLGAHNIFQVTTGFLWGIFSGVFGYILFFNNAY
jgi:membrane-associated phospholipid phosphatase